MAFTTPGTAVAGEVLTAAFWNEQVRDNTVYLKTEADAVGMTHIVTVPVSAQSTVAINNCFSATYANYKIVISSVTSGAAGEIRFRMSVGGTPNDTASSYSSQVFQFSATSTSGGRTTSNYGVVANSNTTLVNLAEAIIVNPFAASPTGLFCGIMRHTSNDAMVALTGASHNQSTSYDGIVLLTNTGTFTGTVRIYGLKD